MKFKEINPGMVIHCPTEEDAEALMKHLKDIGYVNVDYMVEKYSVYGELTCYKTRRTHDGGLITEYSPIRYYRDNCGYEITEFSDLIEPEYGVAKMINPENITEVRITNEMSAVEVLEWLQEHKDDRSVLVSIFQEMDVDGVLDDYPADEIITNITAYEAAKKAPKPVEVKWVKLCRIIQIQEDGKKKVVYEIELREDVDDRTQTEETLKDYIAEHEGRYIAVIEDICRVKEDK